MKYFTRIDGDEREYRFDSGGDRLRVQCGDREHELDFSLVGDGTAFSMLVDGASYDLIVERVDGAMLVQLGGDRIKVEVLDERARAAESVHGGGAGGPQKLCAVMPGVIVDVLVAEGDEVEEGQTLVVLEAMKMQNPIRAEGAGVVTRVRAEKGVAVASGDLLIEVEGV